MAEVGNAAISHDSAVSDRYLSRHGVRLLDQRRARGDIGPCSREGCENRARWILDLAVGGVEVKAWVCDEHRSLFYRRFAIGEPDA